jgi:LPS-assembly protein
VPRSVWRAARRWSPPYAAGTRLRARVACQRCPTPAQRSVDAESVSYDKKSDTVSAAGAVVVRRGESVLRADEVQLNRQTNEAQAQGNAILTTPDAEVHASSMNLDLTDETGELTDAHIYSDRLGYTLSGQRIEKRIGQSYRIEQGRFTTCNCASGPPSWSIAGKSLDVALNGYGYVEGGSFEVLDWPVLWLPRAAFPVFRDRESGLLIPRVGFSNRRGFQLLQPYYWAINKSQDMTVSFDLETSLRVGLLDEYRYAFSRTSYGAFQVGYFNESLRGNSSGIHVPPGINPVAPENRWGIIGNHTEGLGPITGYADVLLVGDDLFLREMNTFTANERKQVDLRTLPFTTSRIGLLEEWSRAFVQAEGVYYQDLVGPTVQEATGPNQDQSLVIQRVPEVDVTAQKQLGLGLMGDLTSSVTDFQRGTFLSQGTGLTGFRTDLRPAAELRLPLGPSLFGAVHAAFRETAYGLTQNEMANGFTGTFPPAGLISLPSTSSRQIFDLGGNVGTELDRVYDFHYFGLDKLKNTIEPTLEYLYVPPVDQGDLPVFDGIDRINKRSLLTYGVASRLLARSAPTSDSDRGEVFELARLSATQSYDFIRDITPTTALDPASGVPLHPEKGDHFSDIDFELRVNPNAVTSLRAYATYDTSDNTLSSATVGIRFREPQRLFGQAIRSRLLTRAVFNVEYRFITDDILQLLSSSVTLPLTDRIAGLYAMRYDIDTDTFLGNYIGCACSRRAIAGR